MTDTSTTEQTTGTGTGRAGWSATFTVRADGVPEPTRALRRVARGHAEFANALFTTITEADEAGSVVLIADDEVALDRLVARLHEVLGKAGLDVELGLVERSGPAAG